MNGMIRAGRTGYGRIVPFILFPESGHRAIRAAVPLLVLLLAVLLSGPARAETDDKVPIEIIELQHRSAGELLPHVQTLVGPRDALTGTGYRLIVRTSPANLRQIRELVAALDQPVRDLRLSVRVADVRHGDERRLDATGAHGGTDSDRVIRHHGTTRRDAMQWVRVRDGQQAHIREGQIIPMAGTAVLHPDGTLVGGVDYHALDRGFLVTPILVPDGRIRLHIAQIAERESPAGGGRVDTRALETVVTVQPGEWVDLGGTLSHAREDDQRIVGTRRTRDRETATVSIKVEIGDGHRDGPGAPLR